MKLTCQIAFHYTKTNRENWETNFLWETNWETIAFIITSKQTKYQGVNLTKEVKELHNENLKTLRKTLKKTLNVREMSCAHKLVNKNDHHSKSNIQIYCHPFTHNPFKINFNQLLAKIENKSLKIHVLQTSIKAQKTLDKHHILNYEW